ncbi:MULTISPECIES: hypothetical protein [unclassified Chryseobacterium]|uniref:bacteriocin-like protein n=1 Tax=unclassified Chryseobacterium TaxID=2593645 RepID=UPI00226A1F3D|nr:MULTISPECIES: hypothetical protein [unclassified Chryseobacterium]
MKNLKKLDRKELKEISGSALNLIPAIGGGIPIGIIGNVPYIGPSVEQLICTAVCQAIHTPALANIPIDQLIKCTPCP